MSLPHPMLQHPRCALCTGLVCRADPSLRPRGPRGLLVHVRSPCLRGRRMDRRLSTAARGRKGGAFRSSFGPQIPLLAAAAPGARAAAARRRRRRTAPCVLPRRGRAGRGRGAGGGVRRDPVTRSGSRRLPPAQITARNLRRWIASCALASPAGPRHGPRQLHRSRQQMRSGSASGSAVIGRSGPWSARGRRAERPSAGAARRGVTRCVCPRRAGSVGGPYEDRPGGGGPPGPGPGPGGIEVETAAGPGSVRVCPGQCGSCESSVRKPKDARAGPNSNSSPSRGANRRAAAAVAAAARELLRLGAARRGSLNVPMYACSESMRRGRRGRQRRHRPGLH